jgi:photosystem II stability/assembly factor-like uncharacterized protein
MKKTWLTLILLSVMSLSGKTQGSWERIPIPTGRFLRSMSFTDSITGWVAADSGMILHTADGGKSWELQETGTFADVSAIFFYNPDLGWASCNNYRTLPYGTELLRTFDGGAHWTKQIYPVENLFMTCILYLDSLNGWMGGKPHALVRTHDGGATWTQTAIDTSTLAFFPVLNINFYNNQIGYAGGGMFDIAGVVWSTKDGGNRWTAIDPAYAPADEVHALHIFDSVNVLGAGGDPDFGFGVGMIRTADGGQTWNYSELGIQGNAYDIAFRNDNEVWAPLGPKRRLIVSVNGGASWTPLQTPDSTAIYKITFPDTLHGYAIGMEGAFLRYKPAPVGTGPEMAPVSDRYELGQNYPNPFTNSTVIPFYVPQNLNGNKQGTGIRINVTDLCGKAVEIALTGNITSGDHVIAIDGSELRPGIYLYSFTPDGGGVPSVRKMVKLP